MAQNQTSAGTKKISNYIMMIVLIVLALSVVSIILAVSVYLNGVSTPSQAGTDDLTAGFLASHWFSCSDHVNVHTISITEASSRNEN